VVGLQLGCKYRHDDFVFIQKMNESTQLQDELSQPIYHGIGLAYVEGQTNKHSYIF
jgi:hypothetical protein